MKLLSEINQKYEVYTQLQNEYEEEILAFIKALTPHHTWRQEYDIDDAYFFNDRDDNASYRVEYRFGWNDLYVKIYSKKDWAPETEEFMSVENFQKFYKKLTAFKNFK